MVSEIRALISTLTEQAQRDSAAGRPIASTLDRINYLWGLTFCAVFFEAEFTQRQKESHL
jgi:hypothetical protein